MPIPKIIHQIWLGSKQAPSDLMNHWITINPKFRYILWTEANLPDLKNKVQFEATPKMNDKADILRYEILYRYGGFFMDADSLPLKPLDDLLEYDIVTVAEGRANFLVNGIIGITPKHPAMKMMIDEVGKLPPKPSYHWKEIGPGLWTVVAKHFRAKILPPESFLPWSYTDITRYLRGKELPVRDLSETYAIQFWFTTSHSQKHYGELIVAMLEKSKK